MAAFKEPKKFGVIPGNAADVTAIQDAGSVLNPSMTDLFPAIYQLALAAGGKAPERTTFNALFKMIMERLYFIERGGVWSYDATADYPAGAVVGYSGSLYLALKDNGSGTDAGAVTPGKNTAVWQRLMLDQSLSNYVTLNGAQTISGAKTLSQDTLTGLRGNGYRIINSPSKVSTGYGVFQRTDSDNWYLLVTAKDDALGVWTTARPAQMDLSTGILNINGNAATATTATTAEACTGNSATATKLAAKRTIALSGAATGTATGFDGSGNITIPVTALAASAIKAQWYAAYPDGAEAHNAMWGGRDITAAFNNGTVSANIANGTFKDIFPGDYITKQVTISGTTYNVTWVIADCDYRLGQGDPETTAHHVVIVPETPIFNSKMNSDNTTENSYNGSYMHKTVIPTVATGLKNAFGDHIITFRDRIPTYCTNMASRHYLGWTGGSAPYGDWVTETCNLMNELMVYGCQVYGQSGVDVIFGLRQLSAFRLSTKLISPNRTNWWLRDVVSSTNFAYVNGDGSAYTNPASASLGVRPFALLV